MRRWAISGWCGAAMKPIGFLAKRVAPAFNSSGGLPITATSISCTVRLRTMSSRLPVISLIFAFGFSLTKATSRLGSQYSVVATAPMRSVAEKAPRCVSMLSRISLHSDSTRSA